MRPVNIGDSLTCSETGKQFVAAVDGCSTNYARDSQGNIYSDEGVDIREKRELLDRSKPFYCYVSMDGKSVTGWKGNKLGIITWKRKTRCRSYETIYSFNIVDIHGGKWYGRASEGSCITLRPMK